MAKFYPSGVAHIKSVTRSVLDQLNLQGSMTAELQLPNKVAQLSQTGPPIGQFTAVFFRKPTFTASTKPKRRFNHLNG
eukprot:452385-Pelagomonas_calceolata.AAC.1